MSNQHILSNQQISPELWVEFLDQFTHDYRGRLMKLEILSRKSVEEIPLQNAPTFEIIPH